MNFRIQSCTFQLEEDVFSKGTIGIAKILHEALLLKECFTD